MTSPRITGTTVRAFLFFVAVGLACPPVSAEQPADPGDLPAATDLPAAQAPPATQPAVPEDLDYSDTLTLVYGCKLNGRLLAACISKGDKDLACYARDKISAIHILAAGKDAIELTDKSKAIGTLSTVRFGSPDAMPRSVTFNRDEIVSVDLNTGPIPEGRSKVEPEDSPAAKQALQTNQALNSEHLAKLQDARRKALDEVKAGHEPAMKQASDRLAESQRKFDSARAAADRAKQRWDEARARRDDWEVRYTRRGPRVVGPDIDDIRRDESRAERDYRRAAAAMDAARDEARPLQEELKKLQATRAADETKVAAAAAAQTRQLRDVCDKHGFVILFGGEIGADLMRGNYQAVLKPLPVPAPAQPPSRTRGG